MVGWKVKEKRGEGWSVDGGEHMVGQTGTSAFQPR